MAIAPYITHGATSFAWPDKRWREAHDDLTEVTQTFQRTTKDALNIGDAFPGEDNHLIINRDVEQETDDCYVIRATGIGTAGGLLELPGTEAENDEGWDEATRDYITTNKNHVRVGARLSGATGMRCVSVSRRRHSRSRFHWILSASYRGMLSGPKEPKIRWTSAGREISKESLTNLLPGGWNEPRRSQVLWPRPGCTISYVSLSVPNVPVPQQTGGRPHPQAPFVFTPQTSGPASDFTWQWPNGWVLMSIETDILPGTTIAFVVESWAYNEKIVIG